MGGPAPVIVFGILTFAWAFSIELLAWQINRTKVFPKFEHLGRDWGRVRKIKDAHRKLFPNSWTRDIATALRFVQISLFALIAIGIILGYMYPEN